MLRWRLGKLELSFHFSFFFLLGLFFLLDRYNLGLRFLGAVAIHEGGHLLAMALLRIPLRAVDFSAFGLALQRGDNGRSLPQELLLHLAGPGANLLALMLLWGLDPLSRSFHLLLAGLNLLPLRPMDGGEALFAALEQLGSLELAEKVSRWLSVFFFILLGWSGFWLLTRRLNPSLLAFTLLLFYSPGRGERPKGRKKGPKVPSSFRSSDRS